MNLVIFLDKVKKVAKEKSISDFIKVCFTYATHLVTYHIMYMNTSSVELTNCPNINLLPLRVGDLDKLSNSSFGSQNFLRPMLLRKDPLYKCYIAHNNDGEYVGFCVFLARGAQYSTFKICDTDMYLSEFYIRQELQNQGLGTKMLSNACLLLKDEGITKIKLAVRNYNRPAIHCYSNVGFRYHNKFTVFISHHRKAFPYHKI